MTHHIDYTLPNELVEQGLEAVPELMWILIKNVIQWIDHFLTTIGSGRRLLSSALEKRLRSERALVTALAEMYVQGMSTRKVKSITEKLCMTEVSAMQVSRAAAQLDGVLQE